MIKTLIVTGGIIQKELLEATYRNNRFDIIIASDKGLKELDECNIKPNYIIGDFDSIDKEVLNKYSSNDTIKTIELNSEKDYTDTHMALKLSLELKSTSITIIGALGTRIDHMLGNINILKEALDKNVECKIIDNNNEVQLINKKTKLRIDYNYKYISLIPLTTVVKGVTLKGFKYLLNNKDLSIGQSIGISNEQIEDDAQINLKEGILILIKSKD